MKKVLFTNEVTKETKVVELPEHLFLIDKLLEELTQTEDFYNVYGDDDSIWSQGYEYLTDQCQKMAFELFGMNENEYHNYGIEFRQLHDENISMNAVLVLVTPVEEIHMN